MPATLPRMVAPEGGPNFTSEAPVGEPEFEHPTAPSRPAMAATMTNLWLFAIRPLSLKGVV